LKKILVKKKTGKDQVLIDEKLVTAISVLTNMMALFKNAPQNNFFVVVTG